MKDWKMDDRTADIQNGAVHKIGSKISRSMSLSQEIKMVAPVRVIKI
jgi:hypothetical protein